MKAVILISGNGSNLQSIIDNAVKINLQISCVISNNPLAYGLKRAEKSNIQNCIVDSKNFSSKEDYDKELIQKINQHEPELIILAGFMRILTPLFTSYFFGKILNIHPSLLPKFPGLNTHQKVIEASEKYHGATVHFVTQELDGGPIINQTSVEVMSSDTVKTLAAKILEKEHILYSEVIHWYTEKRLKLNKNMTVTLNGKVI